MEAKYTKGNWFFKEQGDADEFCILTEDDSGKLKWVASFRLNGEQQLQTQRANAKLMAAAPEMLEVLETIENDANQVPEWLWKRIKSVIKKATE